MDTRIAIAMTGAAALRRGAVLSSSGRYIISTGQFRASGNNCGRGSGSGSATTPPWARAGREGVRVIYQSHQNRTVAGDGDGRNGLSKIPHLDASPLLDAKRFCIKSALPGGTTTLSGGDAARRLATARRAVRKSVGYACRTRSAFAVIGSGVPQELLQDHLNLADSLLGTMDGTSSAEISFGNSSTSGELTFDSFKVRSKEGDNDPCPWPVPSLPLDCQHRMDLYLTVMNRLAVKFFEAGALHLEERFGQDMYTGEKVWSSSFLRGLAYPPHLVPMHTCKVSSVGAMKVRQPGRIRSMGTSGPGHVSPPIIELSRDEKDANFPSHVRVIIQGAPSSPKFGVSTNRVIIRRRRVSPLTLVFDARFSNHGL